MHNFPKNLLTRFLAFLATVALIVTSIQAPIWAEEFFLGNLGEGGHSTGLIIPGDHPDNPCAGGHDYSVWAGIIKDPTCTEGGKTLYQCSRCGGQMEKDNDPPATGHSRDGGSITKNPSCTSDGTIQYYCVNCGTDMGYDVIPATGHSADGGTIKRNADCVNNGEIEYHCAVCGTSLGTDTIPALGHTADEGTVTSEATCTNEGNIQYRCGRCGTDMGSQKIPALGHSKDSGTVTKKETCTTDGIIEFKCVRCGNLMDTQVIPAIGHKSDEGTIVKKPTPTEPGEKEFKCVNCGTVLDREILPVIPKRDTPQAIFDTASLNLTNVPENSTVKINGTVIAGDASGSVSLLNRFPQTGDYTITVMANGNEAKADSDTQSIHTHKPAAPSHIQTVPEPAEGGNGYIGGVDTSMEYTLADQNNWTVCTNSSQPVSAGIYIVRYKATTTSIASDSMEALVMKKSSEKPATPNAVFDGPSHQLRGLSVGMVYSTNAGDTWTRVSDTYVVLSDDAINQAVSYKDIWVKNIVNYVESDVQKVKIARNAQPTGVSTTAATSGNNGSINGVGSDMQYRPDGSGTWIDIGGSKIEGLAKGKYFVRRKGIGYLVESKPIDVTIDDQSSKNREGKPNASFNAYNMNIDGVYGCRLSFDGGRNWTDIVQNATYIANESYVNTANGIIIFRPGNGTTTTDSEAQYITLTKQPTPTGITAISATPTVPGSIIGTDVSMQIKPAGGTNWIDITGNSLQVAAGTYYLRRHGYAYALPSDWLTIVIGVGKDVKPVTPTDVVPVDNEKGKKNTSDDTKKDSKTEESKEKTEEKPAENPGIVVENNIPEELGGPTLATGELGWEAIEATFASAVDPVVINLNQSTDIPSEVFVKALETSTPLILTADNDAAWSILPSDVDADELSTIKSINLGIVENTLSIPVEVLATVEDTSNSQAVNKTFDIKHEGKFGFRAELTMKVNNSNPGQYANLYTYNKNTGSLEFIDSSVIGDDNFATFKMEHASSYVIVTSNEAMSQNSVKELKVEEITKNTESSDGSIIQEGSKVTPTTSNNKKGSPVVLALIIVIVVLIIALAIVLIYQKRGPLDSGRKNRKK